MSRWLDAARKAAPIQGASANSAKRAKSPTIGTKGTSLKHQGESVVSGEFLPRHK